MYVQGGKKSITDEFYIFDSVEIQCKEPAANFDLEFQDEKLCFITKVKLFQGTRSQPNYSSLEKW